jgi:hypothetical protein
LNIDDQGESKYQIVSEDTLYAHERIIPEHKDHVIRQIRNHGVLRHPLLIDNSTGVILDGHHRYQALKELGYTRFPVVRVNYREDESVTVATRNDSGLSVDKDLVLERGLSDDKFPPKTTRHNYDPGLIAHEVPLEELET